MKPRYRLYRFPEYPHLWFMRELVWDEDLRDWYHSWREEGGWTELAWID